MTEKKNRKTLSLDLPLDIPKTLDMSLDLVHWQQ